MERRRKILAAAALLALALTIAWPALDNGFSLDDFNWLSRVSFRASNVAFLLAPEPGQLITPTARLLWLAPFLSFGIEPLPFHLLLLLLHGTVVLLLWRLAAETVDAEVGLLAAALFSAQTAGAEAIFWFAAAPHVLVSILTLAGTLAIVRHQASRSGAAAAGGMIAFAAALLTKGTAFAVLPVAAGWAALRERAPGRRAGALLLGLGLIATAVLALNLALIQEASYLVRGGLYRLGPHLFTNASSNVGTLILPWSGIAIELGLSRALAGARTVAGVAGLVTAVGIFIAGSNRLRWWTAFAVLALAPTLPFAMDPTSRYVYLPSAAASVVAAMFLGRAIRRRGVRLALVALLCVAGLFDMRLRDNHFEHREHATRNLVDGITAALPQPPAGGVVRVAGLPRLGLDPGIHVEAALRLAWNDPAVRLELVPADQADRAGVLHWVDGEIRAGTRESPRAD